MNKLPRPLSFSSMSMYTECPRKYRFRYIDKIPQKAKYFFSFGNSVHHTLEFLYGVTVPPAPSLEAMLEFYEKNWIPDGYKDQFQEKQYFKDGVQMLTAYYDKHISTFAVPLYVEYNFNMEVNGIPITGKVDRVDRLANGKLSIVDYKTGKKLKKTRVEVDEQLTMYQMACEELLGSEVEGMTFYHVPSLKEHVSPRHPKRQVTALRKHIVTTAESILKERFKPDPEERKCMWCDYKPLCPIFKDQYGVPSDRPSLPAASKVSADPEVLADRDLAAMVDRYGEVSDKAAALEKEGQDLKEKIMGLLKKKGYVRAFGNHFEVTSAGAPRWKFKDKKKVIALIKDAGLYDSILAPSAPKVEQLMNDPKFDKNLKARIAELGEKVEATDLKVKPLDS